VEEAWAIQRRLAAHPPYLAFESLNQDAPGALAADLYVLQGDRQRALEVLRGLPFQLPMTAGALSVTAGSHARHLRAELELELGDPEVARYLYAGLVEGFSPPDKLFLANAYDRLGQIAEAAGRTEDAVYYYDRFVRAWTDADSQLQPRRTAVEARLDALRGVAVSATGASAQGG
jgi:tetratricopeptide (TPR) repeat protein